jgi:hypothetical protein
MTLLESVSRVLDALWQQLKPEGESILREAVGRLPLRRQLAFKRAMGTGERLWPSLSRHVLDVTRERLEKAVKEPAVQRAMEGKP